jgi:hypothetical protein
VLALLIVLGLDLRKNTVTFLALPALSVLVDRLVGHNLVELLVAELLASLLGDLLLQLVNVLHVFPFFSVFCPHLVVLQSLVQLFVFLLGLFLFEHLDSGLLLEQSLLDVQHVLVRFKHFSQKVVRSRDRNFCLEKEFHALDHIFTRCVVESNFALDVVFDCELLWDLNGIFVC